jgi:hypothetical protein
VSGFFFGLFMFMVVFPVWVASQRPMNRQRYILTAITSITLGAMYSFFAIPLVEITREHRAAKATKFEMHTTYTVTYDDGGTAEISPAEKTILEKGTADETIQFNIFRKGFHSEYAVGQATPH